MRTPHSMTVHEMVPTGDESRQAVCERAGTSLRRARTLVAAGATLAKYELQVSLPELTTLDAEAAQNLAHRLIGHVERWAGRG
jgi:hypothetical protein